MLRDRRFARWHGDALATSLVLALAGLLLIPRQASAEQKHVVRLGQSLSVIAREYGISVSALATANGLNPDGILREGRVLRIPGRHAIQVVAGQSLTRIAREYHVTVADLAAENHLDREATLQIGQRLLLPAGAVIPTAAKAVKTDGVRADARKTTPAVVVAASAKVTSKPTASGRSLRSPWGRPKQPGVVELYRIWSRESLRLRLVDSRGRARQDARRALREFLRPRDSRRRKTPNARLLSLLARVSDHFGGRPIHVVSGYRIAKGLTRKTSRHVAGQAIDFRIPGVPLTVLRDYCQQLPEVGVGYYPTTEFVHLDVRKQPARWTDWSLPGQPPVLSKPEESDDVGNDEVITPPRPSDKTAERPNTDPPSARAGAPTG